MLFGNHLQSGAPCSVLCVECSLSLLALLIGRKDVGHECVFLRNILLRTRLAQMRVPKCGGPTSSIPGSAYETGGFTSCQRGS